MNNVLKFDDSTIAMIAKLLQIAILSGTDVSSNLRMMEMEVIDGKLFITDEFDKRIESNVQDMMLKVPTLKAETEKQAVTQKTIDNKPGLIFK